MEVEVDVNENDIVKISVGDSVNVEVDAYLKRVFKGRVTNIANTANATTSVDQVTNFKSKNTYRRNFLQRPFRRQARGLFSFPPRNDCYC